MIPAALAYFEYKPPLEWMAASLVASRPLLPAMPPSHCANLLWAFGILGFKPPLDWLHDWLAAARPRLKMFETADFAHVAWALAVLRHRPSDAWLRDYLRESKVKMPYMSGQALADMIWAIALFGLRPDDAWVVQVLGCLASPARRAELSAGSAAWVLWALESWQFAPADEAAVAALEGALGAAQPAASN